MYYYSKFNFEIPNEDYIAVVSFMTSSIVKFNKEKFYYLKNNKVEEGFTQSEIDSLLQMAIISPQEDEVALLFDRRRKYFDNQDNKQYIITILTTTDCNARCYYCYEHGIDKKKMTLATAQSTVDYIKKHYNNRPVYISWFGGEPLYNSEIINYICSRLKEEGIVYSSSITSNAYLMIENIDNACTLWNLKSIQITLDAIGEKYNKVKNFIYTQDSNPFEKIINSIDLLLNKGIRISIRINFDPAKIDETIEVIHFLHKKFGNHPKLQVYCAPIVSDHISAVLDYTGNTNPILKLYKSLIDHKYITRIEELNIRPRLLNCSIHIKGMAVVDVDGNIYKCQHAIVEGKSSAYGNIFSDEVDEENIKMWEGLEFPYAQCNECNCLPICLGGCKFRAIQNESKDVCIPIKNCIQEVIELLYDNFYKEV